MVKHSLVLCEVYFALFFVFTENSIINFVKASEPSTNIHIYCADMSSQKSLSLDQLMGMWYGIEVIQHRNDKGYTGIHRVEACPVLHFSRYSQEDLRLFWHERAGTVEYHFNIPDPTSPGFWISFGPQNGTMTHKIYKQFAGTVQVMKAVASHIVLTFCSPHSELYSIILARNKWLDKMEVRGVRNMLQRRSLPQIGVRETDCNSSSSLRMKHLFLAFVILISLNMIHFYSL